MRKIARNLAYEVAELLHLVGGHGMAAWWINHGPGERLLRWGYARHVAGINRFRYDTATNTITELDP